MIKQKKKGEGKGISNIELIIIKPSFGALEVSFQIAAASGAAASPHFQHDLNYQNHMISHPQHLSLYHNK